MTTSQRLRGYAGDWASIQGTVQFITSNARQESNGVSITPKRGVPTLSRGLFGATVAPAPSEMERRARQAQATALFDREALSLLTKFENRVLVSLDDVGAMAKTPVGWTKVAALMQAYFIEVIGLHMRITEEGKSALSDLREYVQKV